MIFCPRVFFTNAAILENEKTMGTRLYEPLCRYKTWGEEGWVLEGSLGRSIPVRPSNPDPV